ncbi:uncharacterized protein Z519_10972 [Cladophialophora bantiana CBS 173.52]|uniref:Uncharacterized protein n=1 Tax=Cladophialophora bantiana (strain ATCC 10958 / CBS 173.52 / CDC B-1940 / NIH 8579) TaxID=1442370 RepID=A0A0D2H517_CLAB1|nr:uncharacterized protein Z519_10972 [Cladophialophora bantiana CBS 173.52]KIW88403.1 hypothetical protein Z519_10972 [Cladophialophora bantiana CBS 173.52]
MGTRGLAPKGQLQTSEPTPIPLRKGPGTRSAGSLSPSEPDSDMEILGDVENEESDFPSPSRRKRAIDPELEENPPKRLPPSARTDEWEDSSDEEEGNSKYFQTRLAHSTPNKEKTTGKPSRSHRISKSKGAEAKKLSMSKTAVDFRNRKEVEGYYKKKVSAMIDHDVLERVEAEGGITPAGRMYKAIYRTMERRKRTERPAPKGAGPEEVKRLRAENQAMKEKIDEATRLLRSA